MANSHRHEKVWMNEDGDTLTLRKVHNDLDYVNEAVWTARNKRTGERTVIGGPMAAILTKYPADYALQGPFCWMEFVDEPSETVA